MRVTDSSGHAGVVAVEDIEKIVREQEEAVLYFRDGRTLPVRVEDADRLLKCLPELESVEARI
jgi:hypothetical protein